MTYRGGGWKSFGHDAVLSFSVECFRPPSPEENGREAETGGEGAEIALERRLFHQGGGVEGERTEEDRLGVRLSSDRAPPTVVDKAKGEEEGGGGDRAVGGRRVRHARDSTGWSRPAGDGVSEGRGVAVEWEGGKGPDAGGEEVAMMG